MTDYAKEPQPAPPTPASSPRIALVDGDTTTPLSAEALVVAMFACGLVIAKNPAGQIVGLSIDHEKVTTLATALQAMVDKGEPLKLERHRVARLGANGLG